MPTYVESGKIKPHNHVGASRLRPVLGQLGDKLVNDFLNQRLLVFQAPIAESIGKILSHTCMSLRVPFRYDRQRLRSKVAALVEL